MTSKKIKLIATDLDGTLLDSFMGLPDENREALENSAAAGITIVIATGRSFTTVPDAVRNIRGLKWLVCSNGAKIYDNATGEQLYAKYLSTEAIDHVSELIRDASVMKEIFWRGTPYTDRACYENPDSFGVPPRANEYIRKTRRPVDGIADFTFAHADEIENINFIHRDEMHRMEMLNILSDTDLYTLTSSLPFNFEIGGAGVNKAAALEYICSKLNIKASEVMAIGDSSNDIQMIEFAGIGVAMQLSTGQVTAAAQTVTLGNDDCGVAFAIKTLLD